MPDHGSKAVQGADLASSALDAYLARFGQTYGLTGLDASAAKDVLLSGLLADLMRYSRLNSLNFEKCLHEATVYYDSDRAEQLNVGTAARLTGVAADQAREAELPLVGTVTEVSSAQSGEPSYKIRCPCDARGHWFTADEVIPARSFPPVRTYQGIVVDPLQAEETLIQAVARIGLADSHDDHPRYEDCEDYRLLSETLADWCGLSTERLGALLLPQCTTAVSELIEADARHTGPDAARLAARDFPGRAGTGIDATEPPPRPAPSPSLRSNGIHP
ncbi:hypothetical protein [Actinomadura hibisca]|uniref:hypothetical protein n=1 Tax=Actinomadura hibisca TaxID=68565 RepID=UPI0008298EBD|nr:hypothetical protein [Actinomadura hibisca]